MRVFSVKKYLLNKNDRYKTCGKIFTPTLAQVNFYLEIFYFTKSVLPMLMIHVTSFNLETAEKLTTGGVIITPETWWTLTPESMGTKTPITP